MFSDAERTLEQGRLDDPYTPFSLFLLFTYTDNTSFQTLAKQCAECIAFGLPALNAGGYPAELFSPVVEGIFQRTVCDKNSTEEKAAAKMNVVRFGGRTTQVYESPVLVFNFTLLEAQIPWACKRDLVDGKEDSIGGLWG